MAKFSERHYEAVSEILLATRPLDGWSVMVHAQWRLDVTAMASLFRRDNPRFEMDKFLAACQCPA